MCRAEQNVVKRLITCRHEPMKIVRSKRNEVTLPIHVNFQPKLTSTRNRMSVNVHIRRRSQSNIVCSPSVQ